MPSYSPPKSGNVNFQLEAYSEPETGQVDFELGGENIDAGTITVASATPQSSDETATLSVSPSLVSGVATTLTG